MGLAIVELKGGWLLNDWAVDFTHLYFRVQVLGVFLFVFHGVIALNRLVLLADLWLVNLSLLGLLLWVELHLVIILVTWLGDDQTAF